MDKDIDTAVLNAAANVEVETGDIPKQTLNEIKGYLLSELSGKEDLESMQTDKLSENQGEMENGRSK